MELLKDPCYEIWPPIGDQVVPSQNIPDQNADDMISSLKILQSPVPGNKSDDMKWHKQSEIGPLLVPNKNILGKNTADSNWSFSVIEMSFPKRPISGRNP